MKKTDNSSRAVIAERCDMGFTPASDGDFILENMRVLPDGSAVVRDGFAYKCDLPAAPRAVLEGAGDTRGKLYVLAANALYLVDPDAGSAEKLADSAASTGKAAIFRLGGKIYVLDGGELLRLGDGSLTAEAGYVPLYGRNWDPLSRGAINEPMNLLSRKIRIHYRVSTQGFRLLSGIKLASVERFELNGKVIPADDTTNRWLLDGTGMFITTNALSADDSVLICATVAADAFDRTVLTSCTGAVTAGGGDAARVCCFDGTDPAEIFTSAPLDAADIAEARRVSASSGEVYFPTDGRTTVSDGGEAVNDILPCGGDALLFTSRAAMRMTFGKSRTPVLTPAADGVGIALRGAAAGYPGGAVGACDGGIFVFNGSGAAERLSDRAVGDYAVGVTSAAYCRGADEIWLCAPDDSRGRLLVFNTATRNVSFFTDIFADRILSADGRMCFTRGCSLYTFDTALIYDTEPYGTDSTRRTLVTGSIDSPFFDLGYPTRRKRIHSAYPDIRGGNAVISAVADTGRTASAFFDGASCTSEIHRGAPCIAAVKLNIGAFHSMRYRIGVTDASRPRIVGITLAARR